MSDIVLQDAQPVDGTEIASVKLGFSPKPATAKAAVGRYDISVGVSLATFLRQERMNVSEYGNITLRRFGSPDTRLALSDLDQTFLQHGDMVMFSREISGNEVLL